MHAANLGAQVINISEAACYKITRRIDETGLGAAIDYAVNVKNVVIVVAAGNTGGGLQPEPAAGRVDPGRPARLEAGADHRLARVVLAVGAHGRRHRARTASRASSRCRARGSAPPRPAENIIALGYDGNPVNALQGQDGPVPINGTSFAAAYVSGLAALVRQRFPDLTPAQIINRITATARHPGGGVDNYVGAGVDRSGRRVDVGRRRRARRRFRTRSRQMPPPVYIPPPDRGPITIVVVAGAGAGDRCSASARWPAAR